MPACAQCRQRKVRCAGYSEQGCDACKRLKFPCSLASSSNLVPSQPTDNGISVTKKRVGRACDACHARRARCSGGSPICTRCRELDLPCTYSLSVRQFRAVERRRRRLDPIEDSQELACSSGTEPAGSATQADTHESTLSPYGSVNSAQSHLDELLGCDSSTVRRHIDAFFEYIYPVPTYNFLHRADFLRQYSSGLCPSVLLLGVCAASSRFLQDRMTRAAQTRSWVDRAETIIFQNIGKLDITHVQTMMILVNYRSGNHQMGKSAQFLALAARAAYMLKLNREDPRLPFSVQESRRRLMWSIFTLDRFHSGGSLEYVLCPLSSIKIQLPCRERYFDFDTSVETEQLQDKVRSKSELSLSAFILRILDVRSRILQYTKSLLETQTSPEQRIDDFKTHERDLQDIYDSLPNELLFSPRAFQVRAYSPTRINFIVLHLYWHHSHTELYRVLNPGYREALPQEVIQKTSNDFIAYAQSNCLRHAVAIGDMILSTYQLVDGLYISDHTLGVNLYQASCAILYACHRDSPSCSLSRATAKNYFNAFIETLERFTKYYPKFQIYLEDIRNMLKSIESNAILPIPGLRTDTTTNVQGIEHTEEYASGNALETSLPKGLRGNNLLEAENPTALDTMSQIVPTELYEKSNGNLNTALNINDIGDQTMSQTLPQQQELDMLWPYGDISIDTDPTEYYADFDSEFDQTALWDWAGALPNFT